MKLLKILTTGFLLIQMQHAFAQLPTFPSPVISYTFCANPRYDDCQLCSGLLLDQQTILTTAHCKRDSGGLKVSLNNALSSRHSYRIDDYTLHVHPEYDAETHINDLMIIKWEGKGIEILDAPPPKLVYDDDLAGKFWIEGFGGKKRRNSRSTFKRNVPLKFNQFWQQPSDDSGTWSERILFANAGKLSPCFGDSGGPTYVQRPNGEILVIAIQSAIMTDSPWDKSCSVKKDSIHIWLYPHLEWIAEFLD